ncbi:hypothetical protein BT69DRAFT_1295992 [Atractiella rhizophila]|nr:hypothetical protein BT69DRAFT_1295992 [Atractiella rhizophila]
MSERFKQYAATHQMDSSRAPDKGSREREQKADIPNKRMPADGGLLGRGTIPDPLPQSALPNALTPLFPSDTPRLVDIKKVNPKGSKLPISFLGSQIPEPFDRVTSSTSSAATSTGRWIALMLRRLGMTVRECMDAFNRRSSPRRRLVQATHPPIPTNPPKEEVIEMIVRDYTPSSESAKLTPSERMTLPITDRNIEERCRTFVVATYEANSVVPLEMRTYSVPSAGGFTTKCAIVDAARATSG